jgi:hypothetical protein
LDSERNEEVNTHLQIPQITQFVLSQYRSNWNEYIDRTHSDRTAMKVFKLSIKMKTKFAKISEMNEGLCVLYS